MKQEMPWREVKRREALRALAIQLPHRVVAGSVDLARARRQGIDYPQVFGCFEYPLQFLAVPSKHPGPAQAALRPLVLIVDGDVKFSTVDEHGPYLATQGVRDYIPMRSVPMGDH